mgnify:CR=1 FL=1
MNWINRILLVSIGVIILLRLGCSDVIAQQKVILVPQVYNGLSWNEFTDQLKNQHKIRFFYNDQLPEIDAIRMQDTTTLNFLLQSIFSKHNLYVSSDDYGNYFITSKKPIHTSLPPDFFEKTIGEKEIQQVKPDTTSEFLQTNREFTKRTIVIGSYANAPQGNKCKIYGYVKSAEDGKPVPGSYVYIKLLSIATGTSENGYYALTVPKGKHILTVSSIDRKKEKFTIDVRSDGQFNIELERRLVALDEVVVTSDKYHNVRSTNMGLERITIREVKDIPQMLGEKDLLKVALMLPGVQNTGEASSGFNVRGSPSDQTQFFINDVPVYNTSHLFGFFSAFNPDAIKEFKLYKSNIPVEFGGRLASVFDISTQQGDRQKFSASGGISPITGRLFLETPIQKGKSSAFIGMRSTYSNWILNRVEAPDIRNSRAAFYDGIGSISTDLGDKDQLEFFGYYSHDDIAFSTLADYLYENLGGAVKWRHILSTKSKFELSAIYSNYWFEERNHEVALNAFRHKFELDNYKIKGVLDILPNNNHKVTTGFSSVFYDINRGNHQPLSAGSMTSEKMLGEEFGLENSIFAADEWKILPNLTFYGGLRFNNYNYLGPQDVYRYMENRPYSESTIRDTLSYSTGEFIKTYNSLDFRAAINYMFSTSLSFKASVNNLHQHIFMLSNTISISPTAKWKLADYHIKPLEGYQYAFGVYSNPEGTNLEISAETYYKTVNNLIEFRDGADLLVTEIPESDIVQGELDAYGVELMVRKKSGRLNGWFNYTYSHSEVLVQSPFAETEVNFGKPYPANYDKPHTFNIVANYKFSRRISLSGNFVYQTGRPVTYPVGIYYQDGRKIVNFSGRNEYRLPDYFRLDMSLNIEGNLLSEKFAHGSWSLSVYNVLGRKNAYSVYFKNEEGRIQAYKMSVFGTPIFTVTYNFKLGNYAD